MLFQKLFSRLWTERSPASIDNPGCDSSASCSSDESGFTYDPFIAFLGTVKVFIECWYKNSASCPFGNHVFLTTGNTVTFFLGKEKAEAVISTASVSTSFFIIRFLAIVISSSKR